MLLLFGFIVAGVLKFGLLTSYSAYAKMWEGTVSTFNLWSIVTLFSAFLLCPPLITLAAPYQFIGFLTPVYLFVVALTPEWETNNTQMILHRVFSILCAIGSLIWIIFIVGTWKILLTIAGCIFLLMILTGSYRDIVFWLEMIVFITTYLTLLLLL